MSIKEIASIVVGIAFVGGAVATWFFIAPEARTDNLGFILICMGLSGVYLVYHGVGYDPDDDDDLT